MRRRCGGHRRRRRRAGLARWRSPSAARRCACSSATRGRARHQHAQQRRHPRRHLLPAGSLKARAVRRGPRSAVRVLRDARRAARALRQAGRRRRRARSRRALEALRGTRARQRRHRSSSSIARSSARREPHVRAVAALWSPDTGIVEAEALVQDARAPVPRARRRARRRQPARRRRRRPRDGIELVDAARTHSSPAPSSTPPAVRRRGLGDARRQPFTIYPCRGEYAELAPSRRHRGERAGLSAAARIGRRPRRAPHEDDLGHVHAGADDSLPGVARTITKATACRSRRSSSPRNGCCRGSRWPTCSQAAAASAPSCMGRISRSRTS